MCQIAFKAFAEKCLPHLPEEPYESFCRQISNNKFLRTAQIFGKRLGRQVPATHRALHGGGPVCRGPVSGKKYARPLSFCGWTKLVQPGKNRIRRIDFL